MDKVGSKKVIMTIIFQAIIASITLPIAIYSKPIISIVLMIIFSITSAFGGQAAFGYAVVSMVSETSSKDRLAKKLSFVEGTAFFGLTIASAFGGYLPNLSGNFLTPYYVSLVVYSTCIVYLHFLIPDTEHNGHLELTDVEEVSETFKQALKDFFKPLTIIYPRKNKRNIAPFLVCLSVFILQS